MLAQPSKHVRYRPMDDGQYIGDTMCVIDSISIIIVILLVNVLFCNATILNA